MTSIPLSDEAVQRVRQILERRTVYHQSFLRNVEPSCVDCDRIAREILTALAEMSHESGPVALGGEVRHLTQSVEWLCRVLLHSSIGGGS